MKRILACFLLFFGLLAGAATPAQAQRGYRGGHGFHGGHGYRGRPAPRGYYRGAAPRYYAPRYYHAAPYRPYGGRYYYRPRPYYRQPGPAIIIRP